MSTALFAQEDGFAYKPTETWPYEFSSFTNGTILLKGNTDGLTKEMNICLADGNVHYVENGEILAADLSTVLYVEIAGRTFLHAADGMMEILAQNANGYVLNSKTLDLSPTDGVDIGYGIVTSTVAAKNVDLTMSSALGTAMIHAKVVEKLNEKDSGAPLKLMERLILKIGNQLIPATKKDVQDVTSKEALSAFLKSNKIKWNNSQSLLQVVDFVSATVPR